MKLLLFIICIMLLNIQARGYATHKAAPSDSLLVHRCQDFDITGNGSNKEWRKADWHLLNKLDTGGKNYESKFKILYSSKGLYLLFEGEDSKITTRPENDFVNLYEGDVFEVFFHTDTSIPMYLEYEISHLDKELVLLVPNLKGKASGWVPFHYEKERKINKMVSVVGGKAEAGATIKSWSAELFFPYQLFNPLGNVPPVSGTIWNANFYRLDYDSGNMIKWAWSPIRKSFHEFEKFGSIKFE